jgi:hypothetical protein
VNKPNVDVYDVYSDAETSVSSPNQSGSLNSDWRCLTPSHKITVDSLLDRVENLGVIPGSYTTTSILEHIKNMWDPMNQDRDPEAEAASNNFVSGLECFSNLRSQIVDALPSYREEVQELLPNFPEKGKIVEQFIIQRYDIGTGTLPNQYSDLSLSKMTDQVLRRMEVDFKNNPEVFSEDLFRFSQEYLKNEKPSTSNLEPIVPSISNLGPIGPSTSNEGPIVPSTSNEGKEGSDIT